MRAILAILLCSSGVSLADPAVVGHPHLPPLDAATLQRIYTGKVVEIEGIRVTPVNLPPGSPLRARFLSDYLGQDDEQYIGYWTVRRYVGKGSPPREIKDPQQVLDFVTRTAGAIGYVDEADLRPDSYLVLRPQP